MGFRDVLNAIMGKPELPTSKIDDLFAISTAAITMESSLNLKQSQSAGICFKPMESSDFAAAQTEIEELLHFSSEETGSTYRLEMDEFNYLWAIFSDPDFEDLVTSIHLVSQTLIERGFGSQLLCAIFRFENTRPVYWIYNFKHGNYYPFIPETSRKRDSTLEFRLRSLLERELPIEKEVERWYPLWTIPF